MEGDAGAPVTLDEIADKSMEDAIEYIINKIDTALSQGIYIGTIHSVKGLEYDVVHVIGVDGIYFKTMKDEDNMACFYVACTRAKEQLYLWFDD